MSGAMTVSLRAIQPRDHFAVLALNAADVDKLAPLTEDRLIELLGWADRAAVIDVDGDIAGFVLTFAPGTPYDSANYAEFGRRFGRDFYYLDRIVIDARWRRKGLAAFVYDEMERAAAPYGRLVLEVNTVPPNEPSLRFHAARGFVRLDEFGDADHRVALLSRKLA